jgi:predicted RNase H-like nuclease
VPIGLPDITPKKGRTCERLAREAVGFHLSASVFSVVGRLALAAANREQADDIQTRAGGIGIGAHAWGLAEKLREVDEVMTPKLQETIVSSTPNFRFGRWLVDRSNSEKN